MLGSAQVLTSPCYDAVNCASGTGSVVKMSFGAVDCCSGIPLGVSFMQSADLCIGCMDIGKSCMKTVTQIFQVATIILY